MYRASEFIKQSMPKVEQIIGGLFPIGVVGYLGGQEGSGKTWQGLNIAWSVATGTHWLGWLCNKMSVLHVNTEWPENVFKEQRFVPYVINRKIAPDNLWTTTRMGLTLDTAGGKNEMIRMIDESGAKLIIVDNLYSSVSGDLGSSQVVKPLNDNITFICQNMGVSMLFIHHEKKREWDNRGKAIYKGTEGLTGRKEIANRAALIMIQRKEIIDGVDVFTLAYEKSWFKATSELPAMDLVLKNGDFALY